MTDVRPVQVVPDVSGDIVRICYGHFEDGKPIARYVAELPAEELTLERIEQEGKRFVALQQLVDSLNESFLPRLVH